MDELRGLIHSLLQISNDAPLLIQVIAAVVLIGLLYWGAIRFSGWQQRNHVRWFERSLTAVCPKEELAPHLRKVDVNSEPLQIQQKSDADWSCPPEWIAQEESERASTYYLRTGQRVSILSRMSEQNSWYGIEAWIRDILAERISPQQLNVSLEKGRIYLLVRKLNQRRGCGEDGSGKSNRN